MPRYRERPMDKAWYAGNFAYGLSGNTRSRLTVLNYAGGYSLSAGSGHIVVDKPCTILAVHATCSFMFDPPEKANEKNLVPTGFFGMSFGPNAENFTMAVNGDKFPWITPITPVVGDFEGANQSVLASGIIDGRSKRRAETGDHIGWDLWSSPVLPIGYSGAATVGFFRILVGTR